MRKPSGCLASSDLGEAITRALAEQGWQQVDMSAASVVVWSSIL